MPSNMVIRSLRRSSTATSICMLALSSLTTRHRATRARPSASLSLSSPRLADGFSSGTRLPTRSLSSPSTRAWCLPASGNATAARTGCRGRTARAPTLVVRVPRSSGPVERPAFNLVVGASECRRAPQFPADVALLSRSLSLTLDLDALMGVSRSVPGGAAVNYQASRRLGSDRSSGA